MSSGPSIGIIGAGIGGLTAANALLRRGFKDVRVYDQASHFVATAGAGFGFSPNGQLCLTSIGIDDYKRILHPFHNLRRIDRVGDVKQTSTLFKQLLDKFGFSIAGCLRADLVTVLESPLGSKINYSQKLTSIRQDNNKVYVSFQSGLSEEFDLVIGADGIHSFVSDALTIDSSPPLYSGANIFYGVIPNPDSIDFVHPSLRHMSNTILQGPGPGEFISFVCGSVEHQSQIWAMTYPSTGPPQYSPLEWEEAEGHKDRDLAKILSLFPGSHPVHELSHHTSVDRILHFGMYYRKHKEVWSKGRVCLLGDSCHATLPYVGQGANQAIEDAIVLADLLDQNRRDSGEGVNYENAYRQYYEKRSKRTYRIVELANFLNKFYHSRNPLVQRLLDWFLTNLAKGGFVYKQIEKEILEECPVNYRDYK